MKSVIEHIRSHLLNQFNDIIPIGKISLSEVEANRKKFDYFVELMNNRMCQGYFRYGRNEENEPAKIRYFEHILHCLDKYLQSGNQEFLVDAANSCRLEFMYPTAHKNPHFISGDDGEHAEEL
jgi:hypothetical protein